MNTHYFSVVIPAYNAETTLREAVESVWAQTDDDYEIVIIEDGSDDRTLHVALELACEDERIRVSAQRNQGVSAARNLGVAQARGELIAFLDADDRWHPNKLARHRALHEADRSVQASFAGVAFCHEVDCTLERGRSFSTVPETYLDLEDVLIENATCTCSNLVVERELFCLIGGFNREMRYAEDQDFLARIIGRGHRIAGIDRVLVDYRMSEDGLSCDFEAMLSNWRALADRWSARIDVPSAEAVYCRYLARRALRAGAAPAIARNFVKRGLSADLAKFMSGGTRSALTLGGVLAAPAIPARMRSAIFA